MHKYTTVMALCRKKRTIENMSNEPYLVHDSSRCQRIACVGFRCKSSCSWYRDNQGAIRESR